MSVFDSVTLGIAAEAAIGLALLGVAIALRGAWRHQRELVAVQQLFGSIKAVGDDRLNALQEFLRTSHRYDAEAAAAAAADLLQQEKTFYKYLTGLYLKRDAEALRQLHQEVGRLIAPYHRLESAPAEASPSEPDPELLAAQQQLRAEVEALTQQTLTLKRDNQRLNADLDGTTQTVNEIVEEYTNLFGGDEKPRHRLPREAIIEQLLVLQRQVNAKGDPQHANADADTNLAKVQETPAADPLARALPLPRSPASGR